MDGKARQSLLQRISRDGFTVIENVREREVAERVLSGVRRLETELGIAPADNDFEGTRTLRIHNLLARGPLWQQLPVHPEILPLVDITLGPGSLLSMLGSLDLGPGVSAQPIEAA